MVTYKRLQGFEDRARQRFGARSGAIPERIRQVDLDDRDERGEAGNCKGARRIYRYYAVGNRQFCWTVRPDTRGNYYAFDYVPKGTKTGRVWEREYQVRFAHRNKAQARALVRARAAQAKRKARRGAPSVDASEAAGRPSQRSVCDVFAVGAMRAAGSLRYTGRRTPRIHARHSPQRRHVAIGILARA